MKNGTFGIMFGSSLGGVILKPRQAFSLVELLVVLAVIAILAGLLFPVMSAARAAANRVACAENFSSTYKAIRMYMDEYGDKFPPTNYRAYTPEKVDQDDRTWIQLIYPYSRSFQVFECPGDHGRATPARVGRYDDIDAAPDDDWGEFYTRSLRVNVGLNFVYLSPIVRDVINGWYSVPTRFSTIGHPSRTIAMVDSVWARDDYGKPLGGGQWVIVPPCRYANNGAMGRFDTFPPATFQKELYWRVAPKAWEDDPRSGNYYGGAWPWHIGRFTVAFADGHVRALTPAELIAGCTRAEDWRGTITDRVAYLWDLQE